MFMCILTRTLIRDNFRVTIDIWERNKELIHKHADIGEHFTRDVIQSVVFIFLPLGETVHLTNPVYYY